MTTPHSLPQSSQQRTVTNLPFSPGPPTGSIRRAPAKSNTLPGPNYLPHTRAGSVVSSHSRFGQHSPIHVGELPFSSTIPPVPALPRPITNSSGTTHAGGVLPPASFFHPSRPSHSPSPSITRTPTDFSHDAGIHEAIHLTSMVSQRPSGSEESGSLDHSTEDAKDPPLAPSMRSMKPSREPLLPIGEDPGRKSSNTTRPTIVTQGGPYGKSETSAGTRMRDSFEKLWKKGFGLDSGSRRSFVGACLESFTPSVPGPNITMYRRGISRHTFSRCAHDLRAQCEQKQSLAHHPCLEDATQAQSLAASRN